VKWVIGIVGGVITGLLVLWIASLGGAEEVRKPPTGRTVEVYNKILIGPRRTSEDEPLRLVSSPAVCRSRDCIADPTPYYTGDLIENVVCQQRGDWITNENTKTKADDMNPRRFDSRTWYGVRLADGRLGYVNVTWLKPSQRGGLHLANCRSRSVTGG
jgi:hypothetical protein